MIRQSWKLSLYALTMLTLFWQLVHLALNNPAIPAPFECWRTLAWLLVSGFSGHVLASFARVLASLLIALILALPLGIWLGLKTRADQLLSPLIYLLFPIPKIALLPVFILLLGLGELSKITLMVTILIFPLTLAARDGVRAIPADLFLAARSLNLPPRQWPRHLILPATLPSVFSALRVSIGIAISVLFFAENWATEWGLGYFIMNAWAIMHYSELWAGILALALLGWLLFMLIDLAERWLCPWRAAS